MLLLRREALKSSLDVEYPESRLDRNSVRTEGEAPQLPSMTSLGVQGICNIEFASNQMSPLSRVDSMAIRCAIKAVAFGSMDKGSLSGTRHSNAL